MNLMEYSQEELFQRSWPWLAAAVARYGNNYSKADIWQQIIEGKAQLHALPHAAIVSSIEVYPSGNKELRFWLAGGDLKELVPYEPVVADWAKGLGCKRASIVGRRGWLKHLPYREAGTVMVRDL